MTEAAMAILQATDHGRLGITVLNKALFYADLCALRDIGKTLTRSGYIALGQGPVLNHYERALVRDLSRNGLAEQEEVGWEKPLLVRRSIERYEHLSPEEVAIAGLIARKIQTRSATWVSDYSHDNIGWERAFRSGAGTKIDLLSALQQVVESDPWIDNDDDADDLPAKFAAAAQDEGVPF